MPGALKTPTKDRTAGGGGLKPPAAAPHVDPQSTIGRVPDRSRGERRTSSELDDIPAPHGREEDWRFTPVRRLADLFEVAPTDVDKVRQDVNAPAGVKHSKVPARDDRLGTVLRPADRPSVVAWNAIREADVVKIPSGTELGEPVRVHLSAQDGARVNRHLSIDAGHHSVSTVVLTHEGSAAMTGNVEVRVGDGAQLTLVTIQEWADDTRHLEQHDVLVGRDARVRHIVVTLGGDVVRICTNVRYDGPGGTAECFGVYFTDSGQHQEARLFVDHEAPHCRSDVEYRGALQGDDAHSVWVGDVLIRAAATATETYELNRNLVLTDGARADSVPNLEIETGDIVGAGHASATGRFDDEQLFYLQARGIPEREARRLVVHGFFADIINRIGVPGLQGHLMGVIDRELADSIDQAFAPAISGAQPATQAAQDAQAEVTGR